MKSGGASGTFTTGALVAAPLRNALCMVHEAFNRMRLRGDSTAVAEEEETKNLGGGGIGNQERRI